ncbi:hypothetical protein [Streptomyces sp. NPDC002402]
MARSSGASVTSQFQKRVMVVKKASARAQVLMRTRLRTASG